MVFDLFHESIQDNLDLFGHLAMESEGEEQLKYYKNFQQFYDFLPKEGQLEYGRIYTRLRILRETVDLTVGLLLVVDENDVDEEEWWENEYEVGPIDEWSKKDWKDCKKGFNELLEIILKKGAVVGINDSNDESLCEERAASKKYNIEKVVRGFDTCAVLAPLRAALKEQLAEDGKGTPKVSRNIIKNFHKEIDKVKDPKILNVLRALVVEDETTGDLKMKDIGEVRDILANGQLSVERMAMRALDKLKSWNKYLFEEPRLYPFHFDESDDEAQEKEDDDEEEEDMEESEEEEEEAEGANAAVQTLRSSRARLMNSVDDPLPEAVAAAAKATSPRDVRAQKRAAAKASTQADDDEQEEEESESSPKKPAARKSSPKSSSKKRKRHGHRLLKRKKTATQLRFDDDDDDDFDGEDGRDPPAGLSDLPERAETEETPNRTPKRKSQQKKYPGRRVWTDQEKQAVKEGVRKCGKGHWAEIKVMFDVILKDRTSGQIKDCYRTMLNRGELGDLLDTETE